MPNTLPEHVLPRRLALEGKTLEGSLALEGMSRLVALLHDSAGSARFALRFGFDDEGQARVLGRIEAQPVMLCQRCLEPLRVDVICDVSLALVPEGADTTKLDPRYEPLMVGEAPQRLSDLIEDEIILALPNFARHRRGECQMPPGADAGGDGTEQESTRENPFSVLESLKSRKPS